MRGSAFSRYEQNSLRYLPRRWIKICELPLQTDSDLRKITIGPINALFTYRVLIVRGPDDHPFDWMLSGISSFHNQICFSCFIFPDCSLQIHRLALSGPQSPSPSHMLYLICLSLLQPANFDPTTWSWIPRVVFFQYHTFA